MRAFSLSVAWPRYERSDLEACMEAAWRHTDTLIFQSRYQEILLLVQDDPLEDLMRVRFDIIIELYDSAIPRQYFCSAIVLYCDDSRL